MSLRIITARYQYTFYTTGDPKKDGMAKCMMKECIERYHPEDIRGLTKKQ